MLTHHTRDVKASRATSAKRDALRESGADDVVLDTGRIAEEVRRRVQGGVDPVIELVGTVTLLDSLRTVR
jgi:NADPH:quinone reductase